ncbi:MAG: response regulator transcription factor [Candidatus Omnitrophica bacterium]|nr:response regulator transcription factor [Candidatus Omnitrophota bacterium]
MSAPAFGRPSRASALRQTNAGAEESPVRRELRDQFGPASSGLEESELPKGWRKVPLDQTLKILRQIPPQVGITQLHTLDPKGEVYPLDSDFSGPLNRAMRVWNAGSAVFAPPGASAIAVSSLLQQSALFWPKPPLVFVPKGDTLSVHLVRTDWRPWLLNLFEAEKSSRTVVLWNYITQRSQETIWFGLVGFDVPTNTATLGVYAGTERPGRIRVFRNGDLPGLLGASDGFLTAEPPAGTVSERFGELGTLQPEGWSQFKVKPGDRLMVLQIPDNDQIRGAVWIATARVEFLDSSSSSVELKVFGLNGAKLASGRSVVRGDEAGNLKLHPHPALPAVPVPAAAEPAASGELSAREAAQRILSDREADAVFLPRPIEQTLSLGALDEDRMEELIAAVLEEAKVSSVLVPPSGQTLAAVTASLHKKGWKSVLNRAQPPPPVLLVKEGTTYSVVRVNFRSLTLHLHPLRDRSRMSAIWHYRPDRPGEAAWIAVEGVQSTPHSKRVTLEVLAPPNVLIYTSSQWKTILKRMGNLNHLRQDIPRDELLRLLQRDRIGSSPGWRILRGLGQGDSAVFLETSDPDPARWRVMGRLIVSSISPRERSVRLILPILGDVWADEKHEIWTRARQAGVVVETPPPLREDAHLLKTFLLFGDPGDRASIKEVLERYSPRARLFSPDTVSEALTTLETHRIDAIVTALGKSETGENSGFEFIQRVNQRWEDNRPQIGVFSYSVEERDEDVRRLLESEQADLARQKPQSREPGAFYTATWNLLQAMEGFAHGNGGPKGGLEEKIRFEKTGENLGVHGFLLEREGIRYARLFALAFEQGFRVPFAGVATVEQIDQLTEELPQVTQWIIREQMVASDGIGQVAARDKAEGILRKSVPLRDPPLLVITRVTELWDNLAEQVRQYLRLVGLRFKEDQDRNRALELLRSA